MRTRSRKRLFKQFFRVFPNVRELWKHNVWFVFIDLLAFLEYLSSLIRYRIYNHFGAHHLSASQVSVKRNIRQWKNWIETFFFFYIKGTIIIINSPRASRRIRPSNFEFSKGYCPRWLSKVYISWFSAGRATKYTTELHKKQRLHRAK